MSSGDKGEERLERLARQRKPSQSDYHEQVCYF